MVLTISTGVAFSQPVAAADASVDSSMTNDAIQNILDAAGIGDTITFLAGVYNDVSLIISTAVNLVSNGAILNGNSTIFTIAGTNASGTNITNFTINGNGTNTGISASKTSGLNIVNNTFNNTKYAVYFTNVTDSLIQSNEIYNNTNYGIYIGNSAIFNSSDLTHKDNIVIDDNLFLNSLGGISLSSVSGFTITNNYVDMYNRTTYNGISGSSVYSTLIENNTLLNGGDGINIFGLYKNLTINANFIENMNGTFADGISLVNHGTNVETNSHTTITNNIVNDINYGIFLGGHFNGTVSGNLINNSRVAGINSTGKHGPTIGSLNASITNNTIINALNLGISMENPNVWYLNMDDNNITSDGFNIQYNQYYRNNGTVNVGEGNILNNAQNFVVISTMTNDYIQSIVEEAKAGDTITFLAGTYNDIVLNINKALNLVSNGAILNNNVTSSILNITGTNASGTNITGFTFNGNGTNTAINASDAVGINVVDNIFNHTQRALYFTNVNDSSIQSNEIYNNSEYGIYVDDEGNYSTNMNNVLIDGNRLVNSSGGIHITGYGVTITNNYVDNYNNTKYNAIDSSELWAALIRNNTLLNGADGVNVFGTGINLTIDSNFIQHMKGGYGDGISVITHTQIGSSSITNNIINDTNYGIWQGGFIGLISGNIINNSAITAINMTSKMGSGPLSANITNNTIINSPNIGIAIEVPTNYLNLSNNTIDSDSFSLEYNQNYRNNGTVVVADNNMSNTQNFKVATSMTNDYIQSIINGANAGDTITFLKGAYKNIALTINKALNLVGNAAILNSNGTSSTITVDGIGASGTNITGFTINGTGNNTGISLNSVKNVNISNNNITNSSVGIGINNSQDSSVKNNNISGNSADGVKVQSSHKNKIEDNTISKNGGNGVSLKDSDNNTVSGNDISDNGGDGVTVDPSSGNEITDNNIYSNDKNGISLKDSNDNAITGNEIHHNEERGISFNNSSNNVVSGNNIHDNGIDLGVKSVDPSNGATNVGSGKVITVTFTEPIKIGSNFNVELRNSSGTLIAITPYISISGNTLAFIPTNNLAESRYQLTLSGVTDLAGNLINEFTSYFSVGISPTVSKLDPAKNTVVKSAKTIKITFNEAIKAGKMWVDLKDSKGTLLPYDYSISGNVLTITPKSPLGNGKYNLGLHTGCVTDLAGNALALYSSSFTVDNVAPKVSKVDPANGATKVVAGKTIKVTFSEAIKAGSKFWVDLKNNSGKAVPFNYSISGKVLTIDPKSNLAESLYTLCIHTGAVTDMAGNPVALKSSKFSVGTAPTVSKVDPKNGAAKVARSKTIKVTFNENIKAGSNYWIELKTSSGKSVKINSKSISGKVLSIKTAKLAANTKYKLTIHTGAVTDKAGNPFAMKTYTFTTGKT